MMATVGLVALDSRTINAALMKVSAWHKAQGDTVSLDLPLGADVAYVSRQFRSYRTKKERQRVETRIAHLPADAICGGTGFDASVRLPMGDLDDWMPDYSLYPDAEYSIGRLTRGCPRACEWCVVGEMDGTRVRQVASIADFWGGHKVVRLLDDNALVLPDVVKNACEWAAANRVRLHWDALDIRLLTDPDLARLLYRTSDGCLRFSFDRPEHEAAVRAGVRLLAGVGASLSKLRFYVLTNFDTTEAEDVYRLDVIRNLGVRPFVQCYDVPDKRPSERQKQRRRWANRPQLFMSCGFNEFLGEEVA